MSTEKKILAQAIELFRKNGYHSTSMNMVSEACGISKGNLTYHFPTKEELCKNCIIVSASYFKKHVLFDSFEEFPNELEGIINFLKNVKTWLETDGIVIGCIFSNMGLELRHTSPDLADLSLSFLKEYREILKEKIASGQNHGNITTKEDADSLMVDLFLAYEGAVMYSRIANSLRYFDLFIERTYKNLSTR